MLLIKLSQIRYAYFRSRSYANL